MKNIYKYRYNIGKHGNTERQRDRETERQVPWDFLRIPLGFP
jgi:hypothetical protein